MNNLFYRATSSDYIDFLRELIITANTAENLGGHFVYLNKNEAIKLENVQNRAKYMPNCAEYVDEDMIYRRKV